MATAAPANPPSLVGITIRRAARSSRFYLLYGTGMATLFAVILGFDGGSAFQSAFPLIVPIFAVVGSLGALVVFSNDRVKGVLEYLLAYGLTPRRLFATVLLTTLVLVTIVLGVALGVGLGIYVGRGNSISSSLGLALELYTVPMGYAAAAFCVTIGMFWTSLSSPAAGMNSPIGIAPLIGVAPPAATLGIVGILAADGFGTATLDYVGLAAIGVVAAVAIVLVSLTGRLLARERMLSPA